MMNADRLKGTSVKDRLGIPKSKVIPGGDVRERLGKGNIFSKRSPPSLLSKKKPSVLKRLSGVKSSVSSSKYQSQLFKKAIEQTQQPLEVRRRNIRTGNDDYEPLRVRISTGDIVTGMRSDQILLQKKKQLSPLKRNSQQVLRRPQINLKEPFRRRALPSETLSEITRHIERPPAIGKMSRLGRASTALFSAPRSKVVRPIVLSSRSRYEDSPEEPFVVTRAWDSSDYESPPPRPRIPKQVKKLKINITNEHALKKAQEEAMYISDNSEEDQDYQSDASLSHVDLEAMKQMLLKDVKKKKAMQAKQLSKVAPKQPSKVHAQILDTTIQKEIAVLQGKPMEDKTGSGPGVKNFRMVPSTSRRPLTERFKIEDSTQAMEID